MRYLVLLLSLFSGLSSALYSQGVAIGQWRTHLSYTNGNTVAEVGNLVYCGTESGLYSFNKTTSDLKKYSKVDGFSGVGVSRLGYNAANQTLVIVYDDCNIDLVKGNEIINMSNVRDYFITGVKEVYSLTMIGDSVVLSCSFGVVFIDIEQEVIKTDVQFSDSFTGVSCYDMALYNNRYYFATSNGVYSVSTTQNIKNLANWILLPGIPAGTYNGIATLGSKLYFSYSDKITQGYDDRDTVYSYDGVNIQHLDATTTTVHHLDATNNKLTILHPASLRVANSSGNIIQNISGCFDRTKEAVAGAGGEYFIASGYGGFYAWISGNCGFIMPDGPLTEHSYDMQVVGGNVYVATGAVTQQWNNIFRTDGIFYRLDNDWKAVPIPDFGLGNPHMDIISLAVDPNDPSHYIAGSWGTGFYEITNYNIATQYFAAPFEASAGVPYKIGGVAIDQDGNYWVSNAQSNTLLKKRTPAGTWSAYSFAQFGMGNTTNAGKVMIDDLGHVWTAIPGRGIVVLNPESGVKRYLRDLFNEGDLPNLYVRAMITDKNGEVWIGSENGLRTFSPSQVFGSSTINGQKIVLKAEDGNNELLLNETVINDIEVDGGNRKWIATQGSGVRLVSEDGRTILLSFTAENSPLLSNNVSCIAIDNASGEVYFGTEKGIISYRSDATVGTDSFGDVYAFPNPVKPEYSGPIVIKGMANDAVVKITDVAGHLVYETTSLGGQAVWDGKRFDGQRPQTGVYLVFCVNSDASETVITKILFIN